MRVLGVFGVVHPLIGPACPGVASQRRDQPPAPRVDGQVDRAVGRLEQGLDELQAVGLGRTGPRLQPVPPPASGPLVLAADRRPDGRPRVAGRVHRDAEPVHPDPAELPRLLDDRPRIGLGREPLGEVVGEDVDPVAAAVEPRHGLEPDRAGVDARIDRQVHRPARVELGGLAHVARLVEHREPDARGPRPQAQVIRLEDAEADRLDLLDQRVDRVVPGGPLRLRQAGRMGIAIRMAPGHQGTLPGNSPGAARSAPRGIAPGPRRRRTCRPGRPPRGPCSISSAIGPATRCQVEVISTDDRHPRTSMAMPMADSRMSGSISSTSSSLRLGTCGPRTDVADAARIETSLPLW